MIPGGKKDSNLTNQSQNYNNSGKIGQNPNLRSLEYCSSNNGIMETDINLKEANTSLNGKRKGMSNRKKRSSNSSNNRKKVETQGSTVIHDSDMVNFSPSNGENTQVQFMEKSIDDFMSVVKPN